MHRTSRTWFLILAACCALRAGAEEVKADLYVSQDGNDAWSGTLATPNAERTDGPLATPAAATARVRTLKATERNWPIRVFFRAGTYYLKSTWELTSQDSGTAAAPIIYMAAPGERVVISGGERIAGWTVNAKNQWEARLPDVATGAWDFSQFWVAGQRCQRPRVPRDTYAFIEAEVSPSTPNARGFDRFRFAEGAMDQAWRNLSDVEVLNFHNWYMSRLRIGSIDAANRVVTFLGTTANLERWGGLNRGQRYIVENVFEALERPGEFYLDRKSGVLTYVPRPGEDPAKTEAIAPRLGTLLRLSGDAAKLAFVEDVRFVHLEFCHNNWRLGPKGYSYVQAEAGMEGAVVAAGARRCQWENCSIRHVSTYGAELLAGCKNNQFMSCDFTDLGAGGVKLGDTVFRKNDDLVPSRNGIVNCLIAHGGRFHPAAVGVFVGQSYWNSVENTEIADLYYSGISVGWSWGYHPTNVRENRFTNNHIHDIGQGVLTDMGGIYTLGTSTGTVIEGNRIHDVQSHSYGGWGIYFDEGSSGIHAHHNIVYRTKSSGFHQHYGKGNLVTNNVFALSHEAQIMRSREEEHVSFTFERNIVYYNDRPLLGTSWKNGKFSLENNLYWNAGKNGVDFKGEPLEAWQKRGHDKGSIIADPMFVDPANGDFSLKPGSPAEKIGFQAIDTKPIGRFRWFSEQKPVGEAPRCFPPPPTPPPPAPIIDGFELSHPGAKPSNVVVVEEGAVAVVRVSSDTAANGKHSLKFTDAAGQKVGFTPFIYYEPDFKSGVIEGSFRFRHGEGSVLLHEWRNGANPYATGPSLRVGAEGTLTGSGRKLLQLPKDGWCEIQIICGIGTDHTGAYNVIVTLPGAEPKRFDALPFSGKLDTLEWFGFVSDANSPTVFFIDDVRIVPRKK